MARFLRNNDDEEILEGNVYYWKITTNTLPKDVTDAEKVFKLHGTTWGYAVYLLHNGFLLPRIQSPSTHSTYLDRLFSIRAGIVGEDLKEIVAVNYFSRSFKELISYAQLNSMLLTCKCLYFFVEIERKDEKGHKIKVRKQKLEADFKELLLTGKNSDVTIEVKHRKFNCHRCILGTRSPVFAAMFDHDMKGKNNGVVTIEGREPAAFQEFLLYLYSGNEDFLNWKNVADLYKLADKYGVEDLKIVCKEDIRENINKENFFEFFKLARLHDDSALGEFVTQFFLAESKEIVQCENWVTYLSENPVECNILIQLLPKNNMETNS